MRNRRAAQESRDRKKRQFELLEEENRRLQEENQRMKRRIEQLESQQIQLQLPMSPELIVKEEFSSPESFESTFHPAVMESKNDQQCLSISLKNSYSLMNYQFWMSLRMNLHPLFSTLFSLMIRISLMHHKGMLAYSPATFNSLNTGSLFTGAENRLCNSLCH